MLERELMEIGLNEKEVKVYLASLELGQSAVQAIANKSGVNRATTYFVIEGLTTKGLISSFHQGKKQFFRSRTTSVPSLPSVSDKTSGVSRNSVSIS